MHNITPTRHHASYTPQGVDAEALPEDRLEDVEKSEDAAESESEGAAYRTSSVDTGVEIEPKEEVAISRSLTRTSTAPPYTAERFDIEQALKTEQTRSIVLAPTKTADGTILVDWYTTDDSANPQNWNYFKKSFVLLQLCLYSFAAYGGSSMYVSSEQGVMDEFHVGHTPAALGLAIYVVGYGVGPLLFAPLSEIASIGRNWVYIPTFFIFVILGTSLPLCFLAQNTRINTECCRNSYSSSQELCWASGAEIFDRRILKPGAGEWRSVNWRYGKYLCFMPRKQ